MYLAGFIAIIITLLRYYYGDFRYKELYASLTYLLVHLSLLGEVLMPQGIYISSSLQQKILEDRSGSGNKSVDAHTQKGAKDRPRSEHINSGTQASSSSGNTADGNKGKNSSYPYNGHMCAKCDSYGIKFATPIARTCKICGYSLNQYGKIISKAENVAFQSDRLEYIANHPGVQRLIMRGRNESLLAIIRSMRDNPEFASRMVRPVNPRPIVPTVRPMPKLEPASFKARDEDLPPLGSLKINSYKDLPRLGSDKNIDESIEKNKQKASVDQSSSSQNTVAQSPPSDKTQSQASQKLLRMLPPALNVQILNLVLPEGKNLRHNVEQTPLLYQYLMIISFIICSCEACKKKTSMTNLIRSNFKAHLFHLVSPSPWPILTSGSLLAIATSGVFLYTEPRLLGK